MPEALASSSAATADLDPLAATTTPIYPSASCSSLTDHLNCSSNPTDCNSDPARCIWTVSDYACTEQHAGITIQHRKTNNWNRLATDLSYHKPYQGSAMPAIVHHTASVHHMKPG